MYSHRVHLKIVLVVTLAWRFKKNCQIKNHHQMYHFKGTHTNFPRTDISEMPQTQHFRDCAFENHWPHFVNDCASINKFQGLNICGLHNIPCK